MIVHTFGHSTLPASEFLALLTRHGIGGIADVRPFPASRRHPHFARVVGHRLVYDGGQPALLS